MAAGCKWRSANSLAVLKMIPRPIVIVNPITIDGKVSLIGVAVVAG
jgi:hypothetical protein